MWTMWGNVGQESGESGESGKYGEPAKVKHDSGGRLPHIWNNYNKKVRQYVHSILVSSAQESYVHRSMSSNTPVMADSTINRTQTSTWAKQKCLIACCIVAIANMQYGFDSAAIAGLQAMPGFLKVFGYEDPESPIGYNITVCTLSWLLLAKTYRDQYRVPSNN